LTQCARLTLRLTRLRSMATNDLERAQELLSDVPYDPSDYTFALSLSEPDFSSFYNRETEDLETTPTDAGSPDDDLGDVLLRLVWDQRHDLAEEADEEDKGRGGWVRYNYRSLLVGEPELVEY